MHDPEEAATGALYRLDGEALARCDVGYRITNGPAMSPDGRTLYHTDTLERTIYAFDVGADGALAGKRVFATIDEGAGYPDGPAVDAEGCVWTGLFGGWGVRRYSPAGEMIAFVRFPVANVTKIAFGGPQLTTVYATTAWKGLSPDEREAQPLAGGVFRFEAEVPGLPQNEVRLG
jgi:sugar lactone lactonase YvrE